jgi:hypothetical protein
MRTTTPALLRIGNACTRNALPARLAAPFRSRIDPAFRQTLSPSTSQQLRAVAMRLAV